MESEQRGTMPGSAKADGDGCGAEHGADDDVRQRPPKAVVLLVGDYGSGKTEVAVNLALRWARGREPGTLALADLDLVNPYFRCREAREPLEAAGVRVVVPAGSLEHADLPILMPEIKGIVGSASPERAALLDVGGDAVGSRVLAALSPTLRAAEHELLFVVNANRPFNDTVEGCRQTIARIEAACGLAVTGLVANTHLMDETTPEMVIEGARLAEAVGEAIGVPLALVCTMEDVGRALPAHAGLTPLLMMQRIMVPPWLARAGAEGGTSGPELFRLGPG